jgi:response regulator RpfG family c-di-GMP phosphodiesterase
MEEDKSIRQTHSEFQRIERQERREQEGEQVERGDWRERRVRSERPTRAKKEFTILYADDEEANLRGFRAAFRRLFNVRIAIGPKEAFEIVQNEKIDLVVSDHRMPEMSGVDLLRDIYTYDPSIRRMILSGFIKRDELDEAVGDFGIHDFVTKPWDFDNLNAIFNTLLRDNPEIKDFSNLG